MTYSTKDDPLRPLNSEDLHWIVRTMPPTARMLLTVNIGDQVFLAGGFIRGTIAREEIADIDLFCPRLSSAGMLMARLPENVCATATYTENATTFKADDTIIQIVDRWPFETAPEIIAAFDFTVCQAVIWHEHNSRTWKSLCSSRFYQDLAAKRLTYTHPTCINSAPGGSLLRVIKYARRGYHIGLPDLAKIVTAVANFSQPPEHAVSEGNVLSQLFAVDPTAEEQAQLTLPETAKAEAGADDHLYYTQNDHDAEHDPFREE